jgi:DNA-binding response OmpR family regulator
VAGSEGEGVDRILVVDPDDRVAELVERAMADRGYAVDRIEGGPRAGDLAVAGDYALVLMELVMPGCDGLAVLRQIHVARPGRKVVVMSARARAADRVECFECGAVDFLDKPFDLRELLARIEVRMAEGQPRYSAQRVSVHNLALDPTAREVRRGGRWIRLTEREYRLLSQLVADGARVYSREELLAGVWGITDDHKTSKLLEMYVHRLRSKLGSDVIKTVRGAGYRVTGSEPKTTDRVQRIAS